MDPPPPPPLHADRRRRFGDYLLALEEGRPKIQGFQRELPLCLDLVTQSECPLSRSARSSFVCCVVVCPLSFHNPYSNNLYTWCAQLSRG